MFGRVEINWRFLCTMNRMREHFCLVQTLIYLVLYFVKGIHQAASRYQLSHHSIASFIRIYHILQQRGHRISTGSYDLMHTMDNAVDRQNVAIKTVYHTVVNENAIRILRLQNNQFSVIHVRNLDFCRRANGGYRESTCLKKSVIIATINNTVVDNNLTDRVQLNTISKCIPRRFGNKILLYQRIQIKLDSVICRRENSVVTTCRQQLIYCCL